MQFSIMTKRLRITFFLVVLTVAFALPLQADTLYFKSGETVSGKILYEDDRSVTVEERLGSFGVSQMGAHHRYQRTL